MTGAVKNKNNQKAVKGRILKGFSFFDAEVQGKGAEG
jgi:hypothetical protein